ncbi:hypothetical protein JOC37_002202 [Desulfohalotomaculum tongense]|uniref:hypothetical protein n=1 Tax=Desulforadius tongensis TaxID=1216062 RepID=UPI00195D12C6|nr:hypothetical protein [Desulforadius tongensis]MBM7855787.1 hypothetical protein [Desulforadius tongensis]
MSYTIKLYGNNVTGKYTGYTIDNIPNGKGSFYSKGNAIFVEQQKGLESIIEGNWVNGYINGYGTKTWGDGKKYVGNFVNNKIEGQGTFLLYINNRDISRCRNTEEGDYRDKRY